MGSLDDNALKKELEQMQQRLLTALGVDDGRDQRLQQFLSHWNNVKERLVSGIKQNLVSDETKQLAAQVARTVAVVAQGFLNLEKASASVLSATSIRPIEEVRHREALDDQNRPIGSLEENIDTGHAEFHHLERGTNVASLQREFSRSSNAIGSNFSPLRAGTSPIQSLQHLTDESSSSDDDDFEPGSDDDASDYEDDIEPKWDVLRDWVLANISAPFPPSGQEELDLLKAAQIDSDGLFCWLKSMRDTSGWTSLLETYAGGNIKLMKGLCEDVFESRDEDIPNLREKHPKVMRSSFLAMREHIRTFDLDAPPDWWADVEELFATVLSMSEYDDDFDDSETIWGSDLDSLDFTDDWEVEDLPTPESLPKHSSKMSLSDGISFQRFAGLKRPHRESDLEDSCPTAEEYPSTTKRRRVEGNSAQIPAFPHPNHAQLDYPPLTTVSEISAPSDTLTHHNLESSFAGATPSPLSTSLQTPSRLVISPKNTGQRKRKIADLEPREAATESLSLPSPLPIDISIKLTDRATNHTTPSDTFTDSTLVSPTASSAEPFNNKASGEQVQIVSEIQPSKRRRRDSYVGSNPPAMAQPSFRSGASSFQRHLSSDIARKSNLRRPVRPQGRSDQAATSKLLLPGWSRLANYEGTTGKDTQSPVDAPSVAYHDTKSTEEDPTTSLLYSQPFAAISRSIRQIDDSEQSYLGNPSDWSFFDEAFSPPLVSSSYVCPHPLHTFSTHLSPGTAITPQMTMTNFADDASEISSLAGTSSLHTPSPLPLHVVDTDVDATVGANHGPKATISHIHDRHDELENVLAEIMGHPLSVEQLIGGGAEDIPWWGD
ncbi:hypothetical protein FRC17_006531 [Serendipita sp. 399]|nr:hypothetical protein FRC17_006531 [Serendipita sp. 399]